MRRLLLITIFLVSCVQAQSESVADFAIRVQSLIASGEAHAFKSLPCFPSGCVDREAINFIFGDDSSDGYIRKFLRQSDIQIKIFGPYQYSSDSNHSAYAIMYYDPDLVKFNSQGYLSSSDREELWWDGYIETVVTFKDNKWGFYRTPFYYGAHLPWAKDY